MQRVFVFSRFVLGALLCLVAFSGLSLWVFYSAHFDADKNLDHRNWELMGRSFAADGSDPSEPANLALLKGYWLAFQSSSDHISTHLSYCNVLVTAPTLDVRLIGAKKIGKVTIIKDDVEVHVAEPNENEVHFQWTDPSPTIGKTSYYYVRGEQVPDLAGVTSRELVWASPIWILVKPE